MLSELRVQVDVERDVSLGGVVIVGVAVGVMVSVMVTISLEPDVAVAMGEGH